MGRPIDSASIRASSDVASVIMWASLARGLPRSAGERQLHDGNAASAASTAASTSEIVASATVRAVSIRTVRDTL
jgi:hypothetical protein